MDHHSRTLGLVEMDRSVRKRLTGAEKEVILRVCDETVVRYYSCIWSCSLRMATK